VRDSPSEIARPVASKDGAQHPVSARDALQPVPVDGALRPDLGAGDAALPEHVEQHLSVLRAFVHLRLGRALRSKEESQDLVQSVCREVLAELPRFEKRAGGGFRDWLLRTAENKIRDRRRYWDRKKRDVAREVELDATRMGDALLAGEVADLMTPSRQAAGREELERLERAFCTLPADYREVIVLSRLRGWPHERIAEKLGRTELATRTLLSRALARLALEMEAT
jgi:RNA polymerase sigma factor (sigma-70 family)